MKRPLLQAIILLYPVAATAGTAPSAVVDAANPPDSAASAKAAQAKLNPYGREIDLTVNVDFLKRELGEATVHLAADGSVSFDGSEMAAALSPLLSEAGQAKVKTALGARKNSTPDDLKALGIVAHFDRASVAVSISAIDPALRELESIYRASNHEAELATNALPAGISFFLNTSVSETREWNGPKAGFRDPSIFLNGAIRAGGFVLEGVGQIADRNSIGGNKRYQFDRNFLRLVYDIPNDYIRTYLGDLTPEIRFAQTYSQMGGVGISRQRRRFDQFHSAILQGNHQLLLQQESTVQVYRNGVLFQQLQLEPGSYDLSNLPLLSGSNDVRLEVHDASGFSQNINYHTYLDPIDLDPGDWEGALYVGKLATKFGLSPKYDGEAAVTGFYRKAFVDHPALGVGLQASRSVQQVSGQVQFLIGSGRLDATVSGSHSKLGAGYLAGLIYELLLDQGERSTSLTVEGQLQSRRFTGLGAPLPDNSNIANTSAILSHNFNTKLTAEVGATYNHNRAPLKDGYRIFTEGYYRFSRKWFVRGGIDYQHLSEAVSLKHQNGLGFNVSIVFQPSVEDRLEAQYDYHLNYAQASYQHYPNAYVGAVGYGGLISHARGQTGATGYVDYIGNNFDASLSQSISGPGFSGVAQKKVTTARFSTAIAFADGAFAVAPRIGDSFAILEPHDSLRGHHVVLGDLLTDSRYRSISGPLGGAVNGYLASYVTQSVHYDVEDPPAGYDIGLGVYRVHPPYHSGYRLIVGSDAYVTVMGTLLEAKGAPVKLGSGEVVDLSRPNDKAAPFFTNSVGRFAVTNLRPKNRYQVRLFSGRRFQFTVPEDTAGLVDLHFVTIPGDK